LIVYNVRLQLPRTAPAVDRPGCKFFSNSDTEVILRLYMQEGAAAVDKLNGNCLPSSSGTRRNASCFGARDRLGIKPFYYSIDGERFVFGSEIKALLFFRAGGARWTRKACRLPDFPVLCLNDKTSLP
jgi:asparagine synthase (glutamine-hydrolysing)